MCTHLLYCFPSLVSRMRLAFILPPCLCYNSMPSSFQPCPPQTLTWWEGGSQLHSSQLSHGQVPFDKGGRLHTGSYSLDQPQTPYSSCKEHIPIHPWPWRLGSTPSPGLLGCTGGVAPSWQGGSSLWKSLFLHLSQCKQTKKERKECLHPLWPW